MDPIPEYLKAMHPNEPLTRADRAKIQSLNDRIDALSIERASKVGDYKNMHAMPLEWMRRKQLADRATQRQMIKQENLWAAYEAKIRRLRDQINKIVNQPWGGPRGNGVGGEFRGYCLKCQAKQPIEGLVFDRTQSGRAQARGTCGVCGTNMCTFI